MTESVEGDAALKALPHLKCPVCQQLPRMVIGPDQAVCGTDTCEVLFFNPSQPDGGMSTAAHAVDLTEWMSPPQGGTSDPSAAIDDDSYFLVKPGVLGIISTDFVRTVDGRVIHRRTCSTLSDVATVSPWLWAQDLPIDQVRRGAAMIGSRPCCICHPFVT